MGLKGFCLLFISIAAVIEGVYIFLSVTSNCRYIRVFEPLIHLDIRAYLAILSKGLYYRNLLLLGGPFCLKAMAFYRVSVEFLFKSSRGFKGEIVDINKRYKLTIWSLKLATLLKRSIKDLNIRGLSR